MQQLDSLSVWAFAGLALVVLVIRYSLFTSLAFFSVLGRWSASFRHRKIQTKETERDEIRYAIKCSLKSMLVFAATALVIRAGRDTGASPIYVDISEYGLLWAATSLVLLLILHDAYFFFTHRLLHTKFLFKHVHIDHHHAHNPTPFSAFAFHPMEAVVQAGFIVLVAFTIPLHVGVLLAFVNILFAINIVGHLGFEFLPRAFVAHKLGRWVSTSTHHNLHHQKTHGNYGLYFTWWDRAFGTLRADYEEKFDAVTSRPSPSPSPSPTADAAVYRW